MAERGGDPAFASPPTRPKRVTLRFPPHFKMFGAASRFGSTSVLSGESLDPCRSGDYVTLRHRTPKFALRSTDTAAGHDGLASAGQLVKRFRDQLINWINWRAGDMVIVGSRYNGWCPEW